MSVPHRTEIVKGPGGSQAPDGPPRAHEKKAEQIQKFENKITRMANGTKEYTPSAKNEEKGIMNTTTTK